MEELSNKLNSGNPVIVSQLISKLVQIIKSKQQSDYLDTTEFKFLKEKCVCDNGAVNVVAANAILNIVRNGDRALIKSTITDFVTIITTTKCSPNVAFLINNLLLIDLEHEVSETGTYESSFNLRLPQHPFITIMSEDPNSWPTIYREISHSYSVAEDKYIPHYDKLYKPVMLYTLCNPQENSLTTFRQKLWTFVINKEASNNNHDFINTLLSWMQFESRNTIEMNSEFLNELADLGSFDPNLLLLCQISSLHHIIMNNFDPRAIIFSIFETLEDVKNVAILYPVLLLLAKSISLCSSVYLLQLLKLCKTIICGIKYDAVTANIIKSALLQWIANPSLLTSDAVTYANSIFTMLENTPKCAIQSKELSQLGTNFAQLANSDSEIYSAIQIYNLLGNLKNNQDILKWLERLEKAPTFFMSKIIHFLLGLFLTKFDEGDINLRTFDLILKYVGDDKNLAPNVLTVVLYKLSNTNDSKLHYQLLKAIPKMALLKDNLQKIISSIQALNKGRNTLKTFSTTLMLDLWKIDNKCYPYLENFLVAPYNPPCYKWEFFVTRAHVLKELCALKPELYGKEMVAHLSKILNECNNPDGALPCALAIDGITLLCKSEIIDAVTTWATLAPIFKTETRIPVIKSFCELIAEIPSLSYTDAYPKLIEEIVAKLWEYLDVHSDDEVWVAALDALTHFSVEQIVAQTPDGYFDEEILNIRRSGHVVPGNCWIHFLKNCSESKLQIAGDFLIKLVSLEISGYLKFVYQVKGTREPIDYSYLPVNSVVRGISTYIKSHVLKWKMGIHKEVYLQCLRIFSQEYSKPLPPLDWCFLQELFHEPEAKAFCVSIASHQVILSGTARRFIVNYIEALTQDYTNDSDVLMIYKNLKHLANSVQPFTLKPFFDITLLNSVELFKNGKKDQLRDILKYLKVTLHDTDVQEANKIVIAEIISVFFNEADMSSELFDVLLECVILFPMTCIDDLSSAKSYKEVTSHWFKKAVKVRCSLAVSRDASLNLLNELMENGSNFPAVTTFLFEEFASVFEKHKNKTECVLWVLELIGQIQSLTADNTENKELLFLCNIFILAAIVFSGHSVFVKTVTNCEELYQLFPRAIATLMDVNHWSICTSQALEWFYHMHTERLFHKTYKDMFKQCLQCLRHESEFNKNIKWTKYLNIEC